MKEHPEFKIVFGSFLIVFITLFLSGWMTSELVDFILSKIHDLSSCDFMTFDKNTCGALVYEMQSDQIKLTLLFSFLINWLIATSLFYMHLKGEYKLSISAFLWSGVSSYIFLLVWVYSDGGGFLISMALFLPFLLALFVVYYFRYFLIKKT